tara:strand:+ start:8 stop:2125 length:2118 start_codon:yes stop_codon:yes gene_type:complete
LATFEVQVEGLTGLSIDGSSSPTQSELTQYLRDGVLEVTTKSLSSNPALAVQFQRESGEQDSNGFVTNGAQVLTVVRESGTNNDWRPCNPVPIALQSRVTDVDSIYYASKFSPVFTGLDEGKINIYPEASGGGADSYIVYYVNNDPLDNDGNNIAYNSNAIKYFPADKEYIVVLYASCKTMQNYLSSGISLPSDLTLPDLPVPPSLSTVSYTDATNSDASAAAFGTAAFSSVITEAAMSSNVPAYTKPTISGAYISPTGLSALSISAVAPAPPASPSISYVNASTGDAVAVAQDSINTAQSAITAGPSDAAGTTDTEAPTDVFASETSSYSEPAVAGSGDELTDVVQLAGDNTIDVYANQAQVQQWWSTLAHLIEDEEDVELAQVQIGKIQAYIAAYQAEVANANAAMQATIKNAENSTQASIANAQNDVSTNNASMQTLVQASIANAQNDVNASISKMNNSTQAATTKMVQSTTAAVEKMRQSTNVNVQNASKTLEGQVQDYAQEINKYQSDLQSYQLQVTKEVQEYAQNLEKFNLEMQDASQSQTLNLQEYQADIQNELNEFNKENVRYQADIQADLAKHQSDLQTAINNANLASRELEQESAQTTDVDKFNKQQDQILSLENKAKTMEALIQDNNSKIAVYSAQVEDYRWETTALIGDYTNRLNKVSKDYEWAQARYAILKNDYDQAIAVLRAPQAKQERGE